MAANPLSKPCQSCQRGTDSSCLKLFPWQWAQRPQLGLGHGRHTHTPHPVHSAAPVLRKQVAVVFPR